MTTVNIAELCRLCVNPSYYHANVFETRSLNGNRLFDTLNAICQLNIVEGDDLPKYLCMQCNCKVSEIEDFKQKSQKGRRILLSLINKSPSSEEDGELKKWNTTNTGGTTRCSVGEEIEIEKHPAVLRIEQVEEPNEVELSGEYGVEEECIQAENDPIEDEEMFTEESEDDMPRLKLEDSETEEETVDVVSSVPDCLTVSGEINTEAAWHNQEHSVVDVQTVKGSLEMWNLEGCEMSMIQKVSIDKANEESAVNANGCCDNNEEDKEYCRIKETNMYKGRLRNKMRNNNENLADQYRKPNGKDCRRISTKNVCKKNTGDSIACTASQKATKVKNVVKKTIDKPVIISKGCNSLRNKSKCELQHFFCDTCKKGFSFKYLLGLHVRIHKGVRPYKCTICNKSFSWKESLLEHNSLHTVVGKPHVCTECGKSFKLECYLRKHSKLHKDRYPFPCVTCGKLFKSLITFQEHRKIHGIVKPFTCSICKKYFSTKGYLVQHQDNHKEHRINPYSCHICKKSFRFKNKLKYHMYSHDNFKRHNCPICAKSFTLKGNLHRHMLCHSSERPFNCPKCNKYFKYMQYLKYHMKFYCKKM